MEAVFSLTEASLESYRLPVGDSHDVWRDLRRAGGWHRKMSQQCDTWAGMDVWVLFRHLRTANKA